MSAKSVLHQTDSGRGHNAVSLHALDKLLHILVHQYLKRVVWKLVNFREWNIPYLAQRRFCTAFVRLEKVIVCGQLDFAFSASRQCLPPPFRTAHKQRRPYRPCHRQKCSCLLRWLLPHG